MNNLCLFIKNSSENRYIIKKIDEKKESFIYKKYERNTIKYNYVVCEGYKWQKKL